MDIRTTLYSGLCSHKAPNESCFAPLEASGLPAPMPSRPGRAPWRTRASMAMRALLVLPCFLLLATTAGEAQAAKKKKHHHRAPHKSHTVKHEKEAKPQPEPDTASTEQQGEEKPSTDKESLDFNFFPDKAAAAAGANGQQPPNPGTDLSPADAEAKSHTRRWMLKTHQTLGITTWALMAATVVVGQLNYNQLYGGGGGGTQWQTPHRWLVLSTSTLFATTAAFSIFAPNPYPKPLRLDTGLIHRIAVIGATLGMVSEIALGWMSSHQASAGNPNNLRTMARAHQIVGYTTLGFLTVAGAVWVF